MYLDLVMTICKEATPSSPSSLVLLVRTRVRQEKAWKCL